MSCSEGWTGRVAAPRRNHFFYGKMMGVEQFETEQRYGMGQRWLVNRLTLGAGIVCGLQASRTADGKRILVKAGAAVDGLGREILVPAAAEYDPLAAPDPCGCAGAGAPTAPGTYQLCLRYRECGADQQPVPYAEDCGAASECEAGTTVETYALGLRAVVEDPPPAFACDAWLAPAAGGETPPPPPGRADLQARLADMLKATCPVPGDGCVVLASVVVGGTAGALSLEEVRPDGRAYLYSQAQLLDMVLCLAATVAKCCGGAVTVDQPPPGDTLRLTAIDFVAFTANPPGLQVLQSVTALEPVPQVSLPAGGGGLGTTNNNPPPATATLRLTFNGPLDGQTATSVLGGHGVAMTEVGPETPVPVTALMIDSNSLLVTLPRTAGTFRVTLWGTDAPDRRAIRTWAAAGAAQHVLDGEPGVSPQPLLPSGDGTEGGDFSFTFQLV